MKKLLAIGILIIFLVSIIGFASFSLAHDDEDEDDYQFEKAREVSNEKREKALEKIKEHQEKMIQKQLKVKELRDKVNKESKGQKQKIDNSKEFMSTNIDLMIEYLNKLKSRLDSSEDLTHEEAQEIMQEIDERIQRLENLKSKISDSLDLDELRDELKELKELNEELKVKSIEHVDKLKQRRVGEIIKRAESLERKLDRILASANVTNTSQINSLVEQFKDKIADARQSYQDALDLFEDAKAATSAFERHQLILEAHRNLMNAQFDLKSAHFILKEIFRILKPIGVGEERPPTNETCTVNVPNLSSKNFGYIIYKNNCDNKTWTVNIKDTTDHGFVTISTINSNVSNYLDKEIKVKGTLKFIGSDIMSDPRFVLESSGSQIRIYAFAPINSTNATCPSTSCITTNKTMLDYLNTEIMVLGNLSSINESNVSVPIITATKLLTNDDIKSRANGTISTNTTFSDVHKVDFESADTLSYTNNTISFNVTMDALDKLTFKTDGNVTFDLYIDGVRQKNFVYLGTSLLNPTDIPFSLTTA